MTRKHRDTTVLVHTGRDPSAHHGIVNPPVYHTSTILYPSVEAMETGAKTPFRGYRYGRIGTPTSEAFEAAVTELEGGHRAVSTSSGLAAVTVSLMAFVGAGDHVLMADTVYGPTRSFCDKVLARYGVETTYYDPRIGAGITDLIRETTRVLYLESPGSVTFEVQDVPAMVAAARSASDGRRPIVTMLDNTWATPLFFRPLEHGVDVSIHAATKYIVGHSDVSMGVSVCAGEETFQAVKTCAYLLGQCAGPDDLFLALRGLRTLDVRLRRHQENALTVARWLDGHPEVASVLSPALPGDPGHDLWRRDFDGASGLFSILLEPAPKAAVDTMLDGMALFPMGASWGGFESLMLPFNVRRLRTAVPWTDTRPLLRLHVGLEDPEDLIADLARGLERLAAARERAAAS